MLDAPRTDAAFAAALPMTGVPAWRVHLGMPMCGARMVDGRVDAIIELARTDPLMAFLAPFVHQAADEFPAALAALRDQLPVDDEPVGILGGSLGGAVALEVLTTGRIPVRAAALVNPAVRIRSVVELVAPQWPDSAYPWTADPAGPPTNWTSSPAPGRHGTTAAAARQRRADHPALRTDAAALVDALRERYTHPDEVELINVPDLAHPLADEPGMEPAPQLPAAKVVDEILTHWFLRQLTAK